MLKLVRDCCRTRLGGSTVGMKSDKSIAKPYAAIQITNAPGKGGTPKCRLSPLAPGCFFRTEKAPLSTAQGSYTGSRLLAIHLHLHPR